MLGRERLQVCKFRIASQAANGLLQHPVGSRVRPTKFPVIALIEHIQFTTLVCPVERGQVSLRLPPLKARSHCSVDTLIANGGKLTVTIPSVSHTHV